MLGCKEWPYGYSLGHEAYVGGGTGRFISHLCAGLAKKGIEIDLVTRLFPEQRKMETDGKITVHRVRFIRGFWLRLLSFALFSFLCGLKLLKKTHVIHGNGLFGGMAAVALSRISRKPCVITPHGLSSIKIKKGGWLVGRLLRYMEHVVYTNSTRIVFLSANERDSFLEDIPLSPEKYVIIEGATELPRLEEKPNEPDEVITVLYVGRLVSGKGLEELIGSYSYLDKHMKEKVRYKIVGDGYMRKKLEQVVEELEMDSRIHFAGFQKNPGKYYASSDIFILPSSHEGFPMSLLEAMSYGLPCIINDFGVPISHDIVMVMPDNKPETIAEYTQRLANNREYGKMLGEKGRQLIKNRFSFERVTKEYIELYGDLLRGVI